MDNNGIKIKKHTNKPANKQTAQNRVLPHKLTVPQLDKKFPPNSSPILCNLKAYCGINMSLSVVHSPSQMHPVHNLPSCFFRIHFDNILHLCLGLRSGLFQTKNLYAFLSHICPMTYQSNPPPFDLHNNILAMSTNCGSPC